MRTIFCIFITIFSLSLAAYGQGDLWIPEIQSRLLSMPQSEFLVRYARMEGTNLPESIDVNKSAFTALVNRRGGLFSICFRNDSDQAYPDDYYWDGEHAYIFKRDIRQLHIAKRGERPLVPPMYFVNASSDMGCTLFKYHCERLSASPNAAVSIESSERAPLMNYIISNAEGQRLECSFINLSEGYVIDSMRYSRPDKATVFEFKNYFSSRPATLTEVGERYLGCGRVAHADKVLIDMFSIKILSWGAEDNNGAFVPNIQGEYRVIDFRVDKMVSYKAKGPPPTVSRLREVMDDENWNGD